MTDGKSEQWGILWGQFKNDIKYQVSAILVRQIEIGMKSKEWEEGFRAGLKQMPNLWQECNSLYIRQENKKKEEKKKSVSTWF